MWNFSFSSPVYKEYDLFCIHFSPIVFLRLYSFFYEYLHMILFHPTYQAKCSALPNGWRNLVFGKEWRSFLLVPSLLFLLKKTFRLSFLSHSFCVPFPPKQLSRLRQIFFSCRLESAGNSIVRHRNRDKMVTMALCWISALTHRRERHAAVIHVSDCGFW